MISDPRSDVVGIALLLVVTMIDLLRVRRAAAMNTGANGWRATLLMSG